MLNEARGLVNMPTLFSWYNKAKQLNKTMQHKKVIMFSVVFLVLVSSLYTVISLIGKTNIAPARNMNKGYVGAPMPEGGALRKEMSDSLQSESASLSVGTDQSSDQKVIKNGNLDMRVNNIDRTFEKISETVKNNGGEVFSSNFYRDANDIRSGTVTARIPFGNFEKTFNEIKKIAAVVVQESTSGQNVTEEYMDLQAQLKNKQAEESQFAKILEQAGKIDDILAVTKEISRVRGEIESLQGRIKFLDSQTDMATIFIGLSEDVDIAADNWRPLQVAKEAINTLIKKSQGFVNFVIILVITIIPVAILYFMVIWVFYLIGKRIFLRYKSQDSDKQ